VSVVWTGGQGPGGTGGVPSLWPSRHTHTLSPLCTASQPDGARARAPVPCSRVAERPPVSRVRTHARRALVSAPCRFAKKGVARVPSRTRAFFAPVSCCPSMEAAAAAAAADTSAADEELWEDIVEGGAAAAAAASSSPPSSDDYDDEDGDDTLALGGSDLDLDLDLPQEDDSDSDGSLTIEVSAPASSSSSSSSSSSLPPVPSSRKRPRPRATPHPLRASLLRTHLLALLAGQEAASRVANGAALQSALRELAVMWDGARAPLPPPPMSTSPPSPSPPCSSGRTFASLFLSPRARGRHRRAPQALCPCACGGRCRLTRAMWW
jgi:hypothetical protein